MGSLDGKVILITGAARGQGRAHAVSAAREGADVVLLDVCAQIEEMRYQLGTENDLAKTQKLVEEQGRRAISVVGDVRDQSSLDSAVALGLETFGHLDGAIANAGVWDLCPPVWEITEELYTVIVDTVMGGVFRTIKAVSPHLVERRTGAIVVIASVGGLEPTQAFTPYIAAKHGAIGLMKNAALELAPHNVRCNAICPGPVDTKIWDNPMGYGLFVPPGVEATREIALDTVYHSSALAGRSALPPEAISNAAVFLLSDLAEHITGVALPVDAGHLLLGRFNHAPIKNGAEAERHRPPAVSPDDL